MTKFDMIVNTYVSLMQLIEVRIEKKGNWRNFACLLSFHCDVVGPT